MEDHTKKIIEAFESAIDQTKGDKLLSGGYRDALRDFASMFDLEKCPCGKWCDYSEVSANENGGFDCPQCAGDERALADTYEALKDFR